MDLPIDHFRLLGVSPSAQPDAILRRLQSRCDSPPNQGFTHEALLQRQMLLRQSADLLTDSESRARYEEALLALSASHPNETVGLDLSASSEVGGLILLWEAGAAQEAFQLSRQGLQPPQAPALGSGREADLTLLAALSCRAAADEEQQQRRYESAAQILRAGIELQQRMGKLPEQQALLEQELETLLPYRILDLLSRDLSDVTAHDQGIDLLDGLVRSRGGLEGQNLTEADAPTMSQADFESFFQQIRRFLTVQEQIDLFSAWRAEGWGEAAFLSVLALAAAGFARRKPELIEQARDQVQRLTDSDLDPMPLLGCLDLLLGNVIEAAVHFRAIRDGDLVRWLAAHPGDDLAAHCEYCRVWLERDVLPGYRDVDATGVDLDAWFADRDVQSYVDRLDRQSSRGTSTGPAAVPPPADWLLSGDAPFESTVTSGGDDVSEPEASDSDSDAPRRWWPIALGTGGVLVVVALLVGVWSNRKPQPQIAKGSAPATVQPPTPPVDQRMKPTATLQPESPSPISSFKPLINDRPSEEQLRGLIQAWLDNKALALRGARSELSQVARPHLIKRVDAQRAADVASGRSTTVEAVATNIQVVSRQPRRIEVNTRIRYSDRTLDRSGQVVDETKPVVLPLTYIVGRDGDQWKLHEYLTAG